MQSVNFKSADYELTVNYPLNHDQICKFDYDGYESSLEKIFDSATKDYWTQYIDVSRHQIMASRTYLWVCVAIFGGIASTFGANKELVIQSTELLLSLGMSAILSLIGFGFCLYAIPARNGYLPLPEHSWSAISKAAHKDLAQFEKHVYSKTLIQLINRADIAINHTLRTNRIRAKLLRYTSWLIISAFIFSFKFLALYVLRQPM